MCLWTVLKFDSPLASPLTHHITFYNLCHHQHPHTFTFEGCFQRIKALMVFSIRCCCLVIEHLSSFHCYHTVTCRTRFVSWPDFADMENRKRSRSPDDWSDGHTSKRPRFESQPSASQRSAIRIDAAFIFLLSWNRYNLCVLFFGQFWRGGLGPAWNIKRMQQSNW